MSLMGVVGLFSGRPVHPIGEDGRMALSDHLRELRARVLKAALILVVGFVVALFFYDQLFSLVAHPYDVARRELGPGRTKPITSGVGAGFLLYMKICGLAAVIATSPLWLYQIWAFILPGLLPREKRWSLYFLITAGPLFVLGIVIAYLVLPEALRVLISFNKVQNLTEFNEYLSFFMHTLLIFGVAFEVPVFVVALNAVGVLPASALKRVRAWIIIAIFVFAGAATPTTDPFTMLAMAIPMTVLYFIAELIARAHDRRKAARGPNAGLDPDTPSDISGL